MLHQLQRRRKAVKRPPAKPTQVSAKQDCREVSSDRIAQTRRTGKPYCTLKRTTDRECRVLSLRCDIRRCQSECTTEKRSGNGLKRPRSADSDKRPAKSGGRCRTSPSTAAPRRRATSRSTADHEDPSASSWEDMGSTRPPTSAPAPPTPTDWPQLKFVDDACRIASASSRSGITQDAQPPHPCPARKRGHEGPACPNPNNDAKLQTKEHTQK